ncbi:MAG: ABC transporter ATP-binding protein [Pseudomonadota bacterium]|nr:ABC transporter ATP-binding protein [Pseudomonadota bacterium]
MNAMTMPDVKTAEAAPAYFSVRDIHSFYGESYIVQGVSFDVAEGEVVALLGRNGAGKTSTLRTLARALDPELRRGEIWLDGEPIHKLKDFQAAQKGIQLVQEDRRIIPGLTVEENLKLAQISEPKGWPLEQIYHHFPRLAERRKQDGVTLSGGEQQMLAVARALMLRPRLMLLDEPSFGLAPLIVRDLFGILGKINREDKVSILVVEQNAQLALEIADKAYVIETGRIVMSGSASEIANDESVRKSYLGY